MESNDNIIVQEKITKKTGETIIKKYRQGKVLGKGGFATCYEFTDLEKGRVLAAKIISKSTLTKKRALEKLLAEIKIHRSLRHENIVQFEHVFEDKENVYILLEICPNQTLKELLKKRKRISEVECAFYMVQTIGALKHLHERNIIHRDLKLGNMFLGKSYDIKLGDYGLAAKIEHEGERRRTICGTPNYIAPEVLDKKIGHSFEVDIWSLGVICYTLLIGKPPFETNDTKQTYKRIIKNNYSFPSTAPISEDAKDLIRRILQLEPSKRPTLDEILQHPFIKNNPNKSISTNVYNDDSTNKDLSKRGKALTALNPQKDTLHVRSPSMNLKDTDIDERNMDENDYLEKLSNVDGGTEDQKLKISRTMDKQRTNKLSSSILPKTINNLQGLIGDDYKDGDDFVIKWVDYCAKYGVGYILTDGTAGIIFNDMAKLTVSPQEQYFEYIEKRPGDLRETLVTYSCNVAPKDLQRKLLLLRHFKNYLENDDKGAFGDDIKFEERKPLYYVKRFVKTKNALLFKLSSKLVQIDFVDKTQIIINPKTQTVIYKNKKGDKSQYNLETALDSNNKEMTKRLRYTKEILASMKKQNVLVETRFGSNLRLNLDPHQKRNAAGYEGGTGKVPQSQGIDDPEN